MRAPARARAASSARPGRRRRLPQLVDEGPQAEVLAGMISGPGNLVLLHGFTQTGASWGRGGPRAHGDPRAGRLALGGRGPPRGARRRPSRSPASWAGGSRWLWRCGSGSGCGGSCSSRRARACATTASARGGRPTRAITMRSRATSPPARRGRADRPAPQRQLRPSAGRARRDARLGELVSSWASAKLPRDRRQRMGFPTIVVPGAAARSSSKIGTRGGLIAAGSGGNLAHMLRTTRTVQHGPRGWASSSSNSPSAARLAPSAPARRASSTRAWHRGRRTSVWDP